jgi:hypothetical protein
MGSDAGGERYGAKLVREAAVESSHGLGTVKQEVSGRKRKKGAVASTGIVTLLIFEHL